MKRFFTLAILLCFAATIVAAKPKQKSLVGEHLPQWSEGYLDIHTISSGRGECLLIVMPDGTSMVVDAGELPYNKKGTKKIPHGMVLPRPNNETRPVSVYADYIRHFMPQKDSIDYFQLSHFHIDHMGQALKSSTVNEEGGYVMTGAMALYHLIPFREVCDRAYPDYDVHAAKAMSNKELYSYRKFLDYHIQKSGLKVVNFELGATNQFAMRNNAAAYPNFKIENICSNGMVWNKSKDSITNVYEGHTMAENAASCGFVIRYGKFDFLTAGDIGDYHDLEYEVAQAVGRVEAVKAHHHLSPHSMNDKCMDVLQPRVMSVTSFSNREIQPDQKKIESITQNGCKIYCTSVGEIMLDMYPDIYSACRATSGHIVFRVEPDGKRFWVYVLDDFDSEYRIKRVDGPFKAK